MLDTIIFFRLVNKYKYIFKTYVETKYIVNKCNFPVENIYFK